MKIRGTHITILVILAVMVVSAGLWAAGAGFARAGDGAASTDRSASTEAGAPPVSFTVPSMDELRARADYVSPDGREVRIGDVGISAAPVVSRGALD